MSISDVYLYFYFSIWVGFGLIGYVPNTLYNIMIYKALTPEIDCEQTAMGLPPVTSAIFLISHCGKM
jgi:hypothetical protein